MKELILVLFCLGIFNGLKAEEDCPFGHMKCLTGDHKCVPLSWKCDGDADCPDQSDEQGCPAKTCAETEFSCSVNGTCIPARWACDGENDCDNGEDESQCNGDDAKCQQDQFSCGNSQCVNMNWRCDSVEDCDNGADELNCTKTCDGGMFKCDDGQCIAQTWYCDGDKDCTDGSDEKSCDRKKVCEEGEFQCADHTRCIDLKWRCDGDFDCADHSDENMDVCRNVGPVDNPMEPCSSSEFTCKLEGECIHESWKCDGDPDCTDGSDEGQHCPYTCRENQFKCKNNVCISKLLRCDHNNDCTDESDEEGCHFEQDCAALGQFDCFGDSSQCIPMEHVCNGFNDCDHRQDESPDLCPSLKPDVKVKVDLCKNHQCDEHSHCKTRTLTFNHTEAFCDCNAGFKMVEGKCKDIDECQDLAMCSQICTNTKGGYKCECMDGYTLERHHFCRANGEAAWLYYSNRRDIRRLRSDTSFMEIVVDDTGNSVGLDLDIEEGLLFFTDNQDKVIKKAEIKGGVIAEKQTEILKYDAEEDFSSDGIAVDWLYKKIYFSETVKNTIVVSDYDGKNTKTLVEGDLDDPRAVVVDPENGYVYWTDWGKHAKIERCGMDGQNRTILLGREGKEDKIGWPNGLTIDYVSKRLFWIDAKLHKIGSMNLDGTDIKFVFEDATEIQQPFALAVFEDSLYWTDWTTNSIKSVHKKTGLSPKTLNIGSYSVMDIKVYHNMRQSTAQADQAKDLCNAKKCDFLCLPAGRPSADVSASVSCVCGDNQQLNTDGRTCTDMAVPVTPKPTTRKPTTAPPKPTAAPAETTAAPSGVSTKKPDVTEQPGAITTGGSGYVVHNDSSPDLSQGEQAQQKGGTIAIIAGVIVIVIIIAVAVVGLLFVRKYKMKNKKSMNFDNPVYRKTTTSDEHCMINGDEPQMEPFVRHHDDV